MMNKEQKEESGVCCHSNVYPFISWKEKFKWPKEVQGLLQFIYQIFQHQMCNHREAKKTLQGRWYSAYHLNSRGRKTRDYIFSLPLISLAPLEKLLTSPQLSYAICKMGKGQYLLMGQSWTVYIGSAQCLVHNGQAMNIRYLGFGFYMSGSFLKLIQSVIWLCLFLYAQLVIKITFRPKQKEVILSPKNRNTLMSNLISLEYLFSPICKLFMDLYFWEEVQTHVQLTQTLRAALQGLRDCGYMVGIQAGLVVMNSIGNVANANADIWYLLD